MDNDVTSSHGKVPGPEHRAIRSEWNQIRGKVLAHCGSHEQQRQEEHSKSRAGRVVLFQHVRHDILRLPQYFADLPFEGRGAEDTENSGERVEDTLHKKGRDDVAPWCFGPPSHVGERLNVSRAVT